MPRVESSVTINSDLNRVFTLARDVESFPEYMPDVKSVTILEKSPDGNRVVTEFVGIVREFKTTIRWVEEDIWDEEMKTCSFTLVKGDLKHYTGKWLFEPAADGTRFSSVIEYEYDIPLIGPLIKSLIAQKMKQNVDNMLTAIKLKAEACNADAIG